MNRSQRHILMHATGLDRGPESTRNHFATEPRGADYADAMELVGEGFMTNPVTRPTIFADMHFFYVTPAGIAEAMRAREIINLSKSPVSRSLEHLRRKPEARERFVGKNVRIWSGQWNQWWMPDGNGYTTDVVEAGVYVFEDAWDRSSHCGPEKRIAYQLVRTVAKRKRVLMEASR